MATPTSAPVGTLPEPVKKSKSLTGFTKLSSQVHLYTPDSANTAAPTPPSYPTLILICTWMNALPKHIAYYTTHYQSIYPSARILLVTINTNEFLFQTERRRLKDMGPALTYLLSVTASPGTAGEERIHVHTFSNGGAKRAYGIFTAYARAVGKPLKAHTHIFDSAPGIPQWKRDVHALSVPGRSLPWHLWVPFIVMIYAITAVVSSVHWMPRWWWYEMVWGPMDGLVNPKVFSLDTIRGFIYSFEDEAIDGKDVENYAALTEKTGYQVERRLVKGAGHVQLFKGEGGERAYWDWIKSVWEKEQE